MLCKRCKLPLAGQAPYGTLASAYITSRAINNYSYQLATIGSSPPPNLNAESPFWVAAYHLLALVIGLLICHTRWQFSCSILFFNDVYKSMIIHGTFSRIAFLTCQYSIIKTINTAANYRYLMVK